MTLATWNISVKSWSVTTSINSSTPYYSKNLFSLHFKILTNFLQFNICNCFWMDGKTNFIVTNYTRYCPDDSQDMLRKRNKIITCLSRTSVYIFLVFTGISKRLKYPLWFKLGANFSCFELISLAKLKKYVTY